MQILDVCKKRKHLTAICFDVDTADLEVGSEIKRDSRFDKNGCLLLSTEVCEEAALAMFTKITNSELLALVEKSDYRRAVSKAAWFLGLRAYSSGELYTKLLPDFGVTASTAACEKMREHGYIDDEAYARRLAETLINTKGNSKKQAVYKMLQKGIDKDLANEIVNDMEIDETAQIAEIIEKKYMNKLDSPEEMKKVTAALARKGFSFESIRRATNKF